MSEKMPSFGHVVRNEDDFMDKDQIKASKEREETIRHGVEIGKQEGKNEVKKNLSNHIKEINIDGNSIRKSGDNWIKTDKEFGNGHLTKKGDGKYYWSHPLNRFHEGKPVIKELSWNELQALKDFLYDPKE
jgi:hypothetical protein